MRADRLHRLGERMGHQGLGVAVEAVVGNPADVVAGREELPVAGEDDAADLDAALELGHRLGERVQDVVVERVAALRAG